MEPRKLQPDEYRQLQQEAYYNAMHQPVDEPQTQEQAAQVNPETLNGNGQAPEFPTAEQTAMHNALHPPHGAADHMSRVLTTPSAPPAPFLAEFLRGILLGIAAGVMVGALLAYLARSGFNDGDGGGGGGEK